MASCKWYAVSHFDGKRLRNADMYAVVDFYNQINLLYGSMTEFCSPQSCPEMKATDEFVICRLWCRMIETDRYTRFEYLWQDSEDYKRPTKMPAPQYVEHLMGWVQSNIDNEQMFPSRIGKSLQGRWCPLWCLTLSAQEYLSRKPFLL